MSVNCNFVRALFAGSLAAASLAVAATPAPAAVTLGQTAPAIGPDNCSGAQVDLVQVGVPAGDPYEVKGAGTITSWSTRANATAGVSYIMKIFRKGAEPNFTVVGLDGPRILTPSTVNAFAVTPGIPVQPGDLIGLNRAVGGSMCGFSAPGDYRLAFGNLANGATGPFLGINTGFRLNVSAQIEPSNQFQIGAVTRNKKKGTASIAVDVPGPGELTASGKGVKAAGAIAAATVGAAGQVQLPIRAKGAKKAKLNDTGKVKLNLGVTYTPTGGAARTQASKLKLRKNL